VATDHRLRRNHLESFRLRVETPEARNTEEPKRRKGRNRSGPSDPEDRWHESVDSGKTPEVNVDRRIIRSRSEPSDLENTWRESVDSR
jgi:hypothetical protein